MPATSDEDSGWLEITRDLKSQLSNIDGIWHKLVPMAVLFFCMSFINTLLDSTKDALVITMSGGGAESLPFLLPYGVLPTSLMFVVIFTIMANRFSRATIFNIVLGSFVAFFAVFMCFLFPMHETLHQFAFASYLANTLPSSLFGLVSMVRSWTFTIFYVVAELWGDVVLSLLFWGLANETTSVKDAAVLYPLFGVGANVAQTCAGQMLKLLNSYPGADTGYVFQINVLMATCISLGLVIMVVHYFIYSWAKKKEGAALERKSTAKEKVNTSFLEAVKYLASSASIRALAVMAVAQGVSQNILEVIFKGHLRVLCPTTGAYSSFLGDVATVTGIATMFMMFVSPIIFMRLGWSRAANTTPLFLIYGGTTFFTGCIINYYAFGAHNPSILLGLVMAGAACIVFSKAAKFSLFKPAEEMVYIGLDKESRTKGKAAIDVVGSQFGKAGCSCLQQGLLLAAGGSLFSIMPMLLVVFMLTLKEWVGAVDKLATSQMGSEVASESVDLSCPLPESNNPEAGSVGA